MSLGASKVRRRIFYSLPGVLISFSASAQIVCGDAPKDVPIGTQEQLKGDVEGKAQLLTRLLGNAQIKGIVEASRSELYESHKNLDRHEIDMYYMWVACQALAADKNSPAAERLKTWAAVRAALVQERDSQAGVMITGGDNVVSVGQIAGITARTVTIVNPPIAPELRILGKEQTGHPDGSVTTVIKADVASPIVPGFLIIEIRADGLRDVEIAPPAVGGVSMMMMRNVRREPNLFSAEIPSPRGEYDISVTTAQKSDISLAASF